MRVLAASSTAGTTTEALLEIGERLRALGHDASSPGDAAALVFSTTHLAREPDALSRGLADVLGDVPFAGFVGATAFHDSRLREKKPGLAVLVLDGVRAQARTARLDEAPNLVASKILADGTRGDVRFLSVAADPGTPGGLLDFLPLLDDDGVPVVGTLSLPPAGQRPGVLARGLPPRATPAAAVLDVTGVIPVFGVAQAARPLGPVRTVTRAHANVILELDGRPAFEALLTDLPAPLRTQTPRLGGALCAGFGTGEGDAFLMRNVVGLDPTNGSIAVAGQPVVGTEAVFSLRDARAARAGLEEVLAGLEDALEDKRPAAFVVFDCLARDEALFNVANHDVQQILMRFGTDVPVVGIAGGGELCTWGQATHLFGMSCVVCALVER